MKAHYPDTKTIIMDRTISVLSKKGIYGSGMQAIAKACGLAPSTIYHYFASKNELIIESMNHAGKTLKNYLVASVNNQDYENLFNKDNLESTYKTFMKSVLVFARENKEQAMFYCYTLVVPKIMDSMEENETIVNNCPMIKLFRTGIALNMVHNIPNLRAIAYFPIYIYAAENPEASSEQDDYMINCLWNSIAVVTNETDKSPFKDNHLKPNKAF